jgi:ribosomal protein S18 acetylase RimI-like enzyme
MTATPSPFLIRRARPADSARIAEMCVALSAEDDAGEACHMTAATVRRDGFGANPSFSCLIAEVAGKAVGYALHCPDYDTDRLTRSVYLCDLYVEKAARRRGIATALMAAAASAGQARGAEIMVWGVLNDNTAARRFYATIGREWTGQIECSATDEIFQRLLNLPHGDPALRLRVAEAGDCELLAEMLGELLTAVGEPLAPDRAARLRAHGFGSAPAFTAIIAEHNGLPAGYALYWPAYDTETASRGAWLSDLYVVPGLRGAGVGRQLMREVARHTAAFDGQFLVWLVHEENHAARAFYRALGEEWHEGLVCICDGAAFTELAARAPTLG